MKLLYMKQKVMSLRGRFTIVDERQNDQYFVEGTFLQIPKSYSIFNTSRDEIATITKKVFSWLPTFFIEVDGRELMTIKKDFTFFKASYSIDAEGIEVSGNWWDMNFEVYKSGSVIGRVNKKWLSFGDSYEIQVNDEAYEKIIIAIVVAIDCVKADQAAAANASP
ncbi:LURP-one-related/scramblase family protein [Solibacillus silvestris]|uniref:LURP-one-related/scramblase family protein n=1 Tax=Solibacillus silvestris TaxID=76853 RepID=UPI003F8199A2